MSWSRQALQTRLRLRTKVVVFVLDDVTGKPPPVLPRMSLQQVHDGTATDVHSGVTRTVGGAAVFDAHVVSDGGGTTEHYRVMVEADAVYRPDQARGYHVTVGPRPERWPAPVRVRLLAGPAYAYLPGLPVVHGVVVEGRDEPAVPDAVVVASQDGGATVSTRCGADDTGAFSLGIPTYRPSLETLIRAVTRAGAVGDWRTVTFRDFQRSVHLTVRP